MNQLMRLILLLGHPELAKTSRFAILTAEMEKAEFQKLQQRVSASSNELGVLLGVSPQHISQMRTGRYAISIHTRFMLRLMAENVLAAQVAEAK